MTQKIITIHGINSGGEWQESVKRALQPHFVCHSLKYPEYRIFGGTKVTIDLGRKNRTLRRLLTKYEGLVPDSGEEPYLVAHSFGTVLSMLLMKSYPRVKFKKVILVGSALNPNFDWNCLIYKDFKVRNEVGGRDIVVVLAGIARLLFKSYLGNAGKVGFSGQDVHSINGPLDGCLHCDSELTHDSARVHNVPLGQYGHSTYFLGLGHARDLWLPFFWGMNPQDYRELIICCRAANNFEKGNRFAELKDKEASLHSCQGNWRGYGPRESFRDYVGSQIAAHKSRGLLVGAFANLGDPESAVISVVWALVAEACAEQEKDLEFRNNKLLKAAHPATAVIRAIQALDNEG